MVQLHMLRAGACGTPGDMAVSARVLGFIGVREEMFYG